MSAAEQEVRAGFERQVETALASGQLPLLVWQMGKVGSTTLAQALQGVSGLPAFHVHRLDARHMVRVRRQLVERGTTLGPGYHLGLALRRQIVRSGRPARVLTLVREPVGRNLSAWFQVMKRFAPRLATGNPAPEAVVEAFLERYTHDEPLTWFDDELRAVTGLDVYGRSFPHDHGWMRLGDHRWDVLVMRHDLPDEQKLAVLRETWDLDLPPLRATNLTRESSEADLYRRVLSDVRLPAAYVDRLLDSRYARHFYEAKDRRRIRRRWLLGEPQGAARRGESHAGR